MNTVLMVDDDPRNLRILDEILEDVYVTEKANSGEEALMIMERLRPEVVLLDVMMPGIDGLEACRRIRLNPAYRHTKIILVSGKARLEERLQGYAAGADDYLTKPFDFPELLSRVKVFMALSHAENREELCRDFIAGLAHLEKSRLNRLLINLRAMTGMPSGDHLHAAGDEDVLGLAERLHAEMELMLLWISLIGRDLANDAASCALQDILGVSIDSARPQAMAKKVSLRSLGEAGVSIKCNEVLLRKGLELLLDNALASSQEGQDIDCSISVNEESGTIALEIKYKAIDAARPGSQDAADGVEDNDGNLCIELRIARQIAEMHGGRLAVSYNGPDAATAMIFPLKAVVRDN